MRTHGMKRTPAYTTWVQMWARCRDKNLVGYVNYGGRGISVCGRWVKFENFIADMGHRPAGTTLDRIDNHKGYFPENCRWATPKQQTRNRRSNVWITYCGKTLCIADWARELKISVPAMHWRWSRWKDPVRCIETPVRRW